MKMATLEQAIVWLREGKKVRSKEWHSPTLYVKLDERGFRYYDIADDDYDDENCTSAHFGHCDFFVEWEIYEEPKKTITIEVEEGSFVWAMYQFSKGKWVKNLWSFVPDDQYNYCFSRSDMATKSWELVN